TRPLGFPPRHRPDRTAPHAASSRASARAEVRQQVRALVEWVRIMSPDPLESDLAPRRLRVERCPQFMVLSPFPIESHGLDDILAVAAEQDPTGRGGLRQPLHGCRDFLLVVGRGGIGAVVFAFRAIRPHHYPPPPAGPRVTDTRAVSVDQKIESWRYFHSHATCVARC